jgi:hypothetical protein
MSEAGLRLLQSFDRLTVGEKREVLTELLKRATDWFDGDLLPEDLVVLADQQFQMLDEEALSLGICSGEGPGANQ